MRGKHKVLLLTLGVVVFLGLLGVGVALAADPPKQSFDHSQRFVSKLAKILGKDERQVGDAVVQARNEAIDETLDEAVKAGRLTKEQAEAMKQHMQQGGIGPDMMGSGAGCDHGGTTSGGMHGGAGGMGGHMGSSKGSSGNWSPMMAPSTATGL